MFLIVVVRARHVVDRTHSLSSPGCSACRKLSSATATSLWSSVSAIGTLTPVLRLYTLAHLRMKFRQRTNEVYGRLEDEVRST